MTQIYLDAAQWMNACMLQAVSLNVLASRCHSVDLPPHRNQPVQLRPTSDGVRSVPAHTEHDVHSQWHCGPWQYRWRLRGLCLWRWVSLSSLTTLWTLWGWVSSSWLTASWTLSTLVWWWVCLSCGPLFAPLGAVVAESRFLSAENPEMSKVPPNFICRTGQNIGMHASSTARNHTFLITACLVHSASFHSVLSKHEVMCFMNINETLPYDSTPIYTYFFAFLRPLWLGRHFMD